MKTTIGMADSLLLRAKARAREKLITLRSLIEASLAATLDQPVREAQVKPVAFKGHGLSREFSSFPDLVSENPLIQPPARTMSPSAA